MIPQEAPKVVPMFCRLGCDDAGFAAIRSEFAARNPGYDIEFQREFTHRSAAGGALLVFVQDGAATAEVGGVQSPLSRGDVIALRPGESLAADAALAVLLITSPEELPREVPSFLRPDADPMLANAAGGCAEQPGSYRRMVLTWLDDNGPYRYRALNAHRVRITDSFTHYHPVRGGFDELYLVQEVAPGAHLVTTHHVDRISRPGSIEAADLDGLLDVHEVQVGDLVYLPRGTAHRGVGGVLAHVITVPGFRPGAEIGIDHHLRAINERLALSLEEALPFNKAASLAPAVK